MDESELAAVVLALRQLHVPQRLEPPVTSAWQLSDRFPELEIDDVRAMSRSGLRVP